MACSADRMHPGAWPACQLSHLCLHHKSDRLILQLRGGALKQLNGLLHHTVCKRFLLLRIWHFVQDVKGKTSMAVCVSRTVVPVASTAFRGPFAVMRKALEFSLLELLLLFVFCGISEIHSALIANSIVRIPGSQRVLGTHM